MHCSQKLENGKRILLRFPFSGLVRTLIDRRPVLVRVVFLNGGCELGRVGAQVLFIHDASLADHERHDSSLTVLDGRGEYRESPSHFSIYDVALCSAWGVVALGAKHM